MDVWTVLIVLSGMLIYGYLTWRWYSSIAEDHELALNLLIEEEEADRRQSYEAACAVRERAEAALDELARLEGEDVRLAGEAFAALGLRVAEFDDLQTRIKNVSETAANLYRGDFRQAYRGAATLPKYFEEEARFEGLTRAFVELETVTTQIAKLRRNLATLDRDASRAKAAIEESFKVFDGEPTDVAQAAE